MKIIIHFKNFLLEAYKFVAVSVDNEKMNFTVMLHK